MSHHEARDLTPRAPTPTAGLSVAQARATANERDRLVQRVASITDPSVLLRVRKALDQALEGDRRDEYDLMLTRVLEGDEPDEPLEVGVELPDGSSLGTLEKRLAPWNFLLSCVAFVVLGLVLMLLPDPDIVLSPLAFGGLLGTAVVLGIFFILEFAIFVRLSKRDHQPVRPRYLRRRALALLFPPARMCFHDVATGQFIWLPVWGWSKVNHRLFEALRRTFSTPMIVVALLIVPVLLIEWKFMETISAVFPGGESSLHSALQVAQALIWAAFAFEFFLMVSVAEDRIDYCKRSWLDILIILLPLVSFFRSIRVLRAARLNQLARGYRLKGVIIKARQAFMLAEAIQRILFPSPEKQAAAIARRMKQNRRDRAELERLALAAVERIRAKQRVSDTQDETADPAQ